MKIHLLFIVLLLTSVSSVADETGKQTSIPLLSLNGIHWTSEETAYIKKLNRKGSITIATKIAPTVYMPEKDGSNSAFHFRFLKVLTDLLGVNIDVRLVDWDDYFYKKGESLERIKSNPNYTYIPTLIEELDLYLDGMTALPWREKMFDIVKFIPTRQMLVSRKDNKPQGIAKLNGKTFAMVKNTSMEQNLEAIKRANHIDFNYVYLDNFNDMEKWVAQGKADFTVYDSDRAFQALKNFDNLDIAWPISKPEIMGWAIHKKNSMLKSVLEKYIEYAQANTILDTLWESAYGLSFIEYLNILKLGI